MCAWMDARCAMRRHACSHAAQEQLPLARDTLRHLLALPCAVMHACMSLWHLVASCFLMLLHVCVCMCVYVCVCAWHVVASFLQCRWSATAFEHFPAGVSPSSKCLDRCVCACVCEIPCTRQPCGHAYTTPHTNSHPPILSKTAHKLNNHPPTRPPSLPNTHAVEHSSACRGESVAGGLFRVNDSLVGR